MQMCSHCGDDLGAYSGRGRPRSRCEKCRLGEQAKHVRAYKERHQMRGGVKGAALLPPKEHRGPQRTGKSRYHYLYRPNHPNADKLGRVMEHRYVLSEKLGRPLTKDETVHHKNGQRHDNRPENLELRVGAHGQGITVEESLVWADEIIARYRV